MYRSALRILAWITLVVIVFFTLANVQERPHLEEGANFDRAIAYLTLGGLFGLAYPRQALYALGLVLLAGVGLELAQLLTPDRHARMIDAVVKAGAGAIGVAAGLMVGRVAARAGERH